MRAGWKTPGAEWAAALGLYLAVVLDLLLIPFDFFGEEISLSRVHGGFVFPEGVTVVELLEWTKSFGHAALFAPLGILVGSLRLPGAGVGWRALGAVSVGAVGSEALQLTVGRGTSVADAVMDLLGYLIGLWLVSRWRRSPFLRSVVSAAARPAVAFGLLVVLGGCFWLLFRPTDRLPFGGPPLASWDLENPLCIANELTGRRPWIGTIEELRIHDRALSPAEIAGTPATGDLDASVVAAYRFAPGAGPSGPGDPLPALRGPPLSLERGEAYVLAGDGIRFPGRALLVGRGPAWSEALRAIVRSGALSIRVRFATSSVGQSGPARIVSSSSNVRSRNFTLGQVRSGLELRVRHALSDPNGMTPVLRVRDCLEAGRSTEVVAVYSGGKLSLYVDGRLRGASQACLASGAVRFWTGGAWGRRVAAGLAFVAWGSATALAWIGLRSAGTRFPRALIGGGALAAGVVGLALAAVAITG